MESKNTWNNLLDSDGIYFNQANMLLEKCENLLELSVKLLIIQSSLASLISLDQTKCEKPNVNIVCSKVRSYQEELSKSNYNLIPLKGE